MKYEKDNKPFAFLSEDGSSARDFFTGKALIMQAYGTIVYNQALEDLEI